MSEYGNGLLKATERMIYYCKRSIEGIKNSGAKPNTTRQITNGGKLLAYNRMLRKLESTKSNLIKKK